MHAAVALAQELVRVDTAGDRERLLVQALAGRLEQSGLAVERYPLAEGRASLVASIGTPKITLTGHLDTVPFDPERWSVSPTAAIVRNGRLFGRGASDMKAGVAALVVAVERHGQYRHACEGIRLVLTAGEELGCLGARTLVDAGAAGGGEILVVAEPTGNEPHLGHKGATWYEVVARGKGAHGSRPDLGHNAIIDLARVALALTEGAPDVAHPQLGRATINVGTFRGGTQPNLVPDEARMTVDVRTVPGFDPAVVEALIERSGRGRLEVRRILDLPSVWSSGASEPIRKALRAISRVRRAVELPGLSYFTDASVLSAAGAYEATMVLGPGDAEEAHAVNESCSVRLIEEAVEIYGALLNEWCAKQ